MGMYTELNIGVKLYSNTPENILDILRYMVGDINIEPDDKPNHPLFETDRWRMLFMSDSYYFDGITNSVLDYDGITEAYYLTVRSNFKNYDDEINKFLDFIRPYLDTKGFLGYYRYEEDEYPVLIYNSYREDGITIVSIAG